MMKIDPSYNEGTRKEFVEFLIAIKSYGYAAQDPILGKLLLKNWSRSKRYHLTG